MDPAYYSALERAIQNAPMEHATAAGWQDWLRAAVNRAEVKEDELKWTTLVARLHDAAPNAGDRLTRETVQEIFEVNAVWVHTLSGEGLPEWEVRTLRGETVHATRSRAMEIYQQELAWGEQGVVVIRDNPARITVESYEDRQPDFARADFGIAAGDDGKLHWQCERFPHKRWIVDQDLFDRAAAEKFAREHIAMLDELFAAHAPHEFFFLPDDGNLLFRNALGATESCAVSADCWLETESQRLFASRTQALDTAEAVAEQVRGRLLLNVQRPIPVQSAHDIRRGEPVYGAFSFAEDRAAQNYREILLTLSSEAPTLAKVEYQSSHWRDVKNVVAHIRLTDFGKTLLVEELQSDWGKDVRDNRKGVPQAPFIGSTQKWLTLALKKVLHEAAHGDYEQVAFINGRQSAERYELRKDARYLTLYFNIFANRVELSVADDNRDSIPLNQDGDTTLFFAPGTERAGIQAVIGEELADALLKQDKHEMPNGCLLQMLEAPEHETFRVGGQGMLAFYDQIVPNTLRPLLQKLDPDVRLVPTAEVSGWSGKVAAGREEGEPQWGFAMTDTLREKVKKGQALFSFASAPVQEEVRQDRQGSLPRFRNAQELLVRNLGLNTARLITLTDRLPDGSPLLTEGVHTRDDGQTCINPDRIEPLYDTDGSEILSRDERVLWVAYHELFHRGITVTGAKTLEKELMRADSHPFVHALADAITQERIALAPEAAPRRRLEAVEEALAELYAARESGRMETLHRRYLPYAPDLPQPPSHGDWVIRLHDYNSAICFTFRKVGEGWLAMNDTQVVELLGRVGDAVRRELPPVRRIHDEVTQQQERTTTPPDFSGCVSPREAGKRAWEAMGGDMGRLAEVIGGLDAQGYRVDVRRLQDLPQHPLLQREIFLSAVGPTAQANRKQPQREH